MIGEDSIRRSAAGNRHAD